MVAKRSPNLATLTSVWQSHPGDWFGPFLFNASIHCFCFGLLCSQILTYSTLFRTDPKWIKWLVAVVFCLSALTAGRSFVFVLYQNVLGFGDWEGAVGRRWGLYPEALLVVVTSAAVQSFFGWRCYSLTNRNRLLLSVLVIGILSTIGLAIAVTIQLASDPYDGPALNRLGIPVLILGTVLDIAITVIVSYKLTSSRNLLNPNTDALLDKLLAIAWESALPPCIMQMANVAICLTVRPMWGYIGNSLTMWLYVFSLMHTLNSRSKVRMAQNVMIEAYSQERVNGSVNIGIDLDQGIPLKLALPTHQGKMANSMPLLTPGSPAHEQHGGVANAPPQLGNVATINGPLLQAILPC